MKKILFIPFFSLLTLVVFLFSISNAYADTSVNCYYDNFDTYFTLYLANEEYFENLISSNTNLLITTNNGNFVAFYPSSMSSSSLFSTIVLANYSSTGMNRWENNSFSGWGGWSSNSSILYFQCPASNNGLPSNGYFYSSTDYYLPTTGIDTLVFPEFTSSVFNATIPSITIAPGDKIPTYYDLYQEYILTPPGPVDEYPVITSFFNISIDKIKLVAEYFSSNYLYLSLFSIFIFIFFLYLLKRRLF